MTTTSECLTVRANGVDIGTIHVGSRVVLHEAEEWSRGETKQMRRKSNRGNWYTEAVTLKQRLTELAGYELGGRLYDAAKDAEVVRIADENKY